jgi:hypothetical protein
MNRLLQPSPRFSLFNCILLGALCLAFVPAIAAQTGRRVRSIGREQLRSRFTVAAGKDFEIVKDEFKRSPNAGGGSNYWLVYIKPKQAGFFKLTYRYKYSDSHYSHVEREFGINVGQRSCRRGAPSAGSYYRFCLDDTIIVPVIIDGFTEHQFSLTSSAYTPDQDLAYEPAKSYSSAETSAGPLVNNPLAEHLRFVSSESYRQLHRNGGYTLESYAVFEAVRPGRFNLDLSLNSDPSAAEPGVPRALPASAKLRTTKKAKREPFIKSVDVVGIPMIIVSRETPVTLLASHHEVRGYTMGYNGEEYVSSVSGDAYMVGVMILQPGDRISLKYFTTIRSREFERSQLTATDQADDSHSRSELSDKVPPPLIAKHPFALNTEYDFTGWLADYLPR